MKDQLGPRVPRFHEHLFTYFQQTNEKGFILALVDKNIAESIVLSCEPQIHLSYGNVTQNFQ